MSKGGFIAFRGAAAVAEAYLAGKEQPAQSANASASYLASADRPFQHGAITAEGAEVGTMSREEFRSWAEHIDPDTGEVRGKFRVRKTHSVGKDGELVEKIGGTPLYQETLISASKSLSLAAAASPRIAEVLDEAMARATVQMASVFHEHAVTRVGPRGRQQQVKLDKIEFTSVQHRTSRTGDPHEHRHVQFLSAGLVTLPSGKQEWRSLDGAVLYRLPERLHAAADLALSTDEELRQAIADEGFTWEPGEGGGKVAEFESLTDEFSQRRDQVSAHRESLEAQWRAEHPGQEPSKKQVRSWDNRAWSTTRPEKSELELGAQMDQAARLAVIAPTNTEHVVRSERAAQLSATTIADDALAAIAVEHAAWSRADVRAAIDRRLADTYLLASDDVAELQAAAMAAAERELVSFHDAGVDVEGQRHYTSREVLATDEAIDASLRRRAEHRGRDGEVEIDRGSFTLSEGQAAAARAIAGTHRLVAVEGAAGTGKTALLAAACDAIFDDDRRIVAVSPTKRGAMEMAREIGAEGSSVHKLLMNAGATVDERGRWTRPSSWATQPQDLWMDEDTVLIVDEAGMLDMETARMLHEYCDDTGAQIVLLGDRQQLKAVGRSGYLQKAVHLATTAHDLRDVRRFRTVDGELDDVYADASLKLRERRDADEVFELLEQRGQVRTGDPDEVIERVAETVALEVSAAESSVAIASTNAVAQRINRAVYDRLAADGALDTNVTTTGRDGDPIAKGARVATRQNDAELQVANRQTWIVKRVNRDGRVVVADEATGVHTTLSADYAREHLQLAYAVTAHGSQGMTVDTSHFVLSDQADAAAAYVGLTRGRRANVLHTVAVDLDDAKEQFEAAMRRQGADQGLDAARAEAQQGSGLQRILEGVTVAEIMSVEPGQLDQQDEAELDAEAQAILAQLEERQHARPAWAARRRPVERTEPNRREQAERPVPAAPKRPVPVVEQPAPEPAYRSSLRDLDLQAEADNRRLAGLAELEERWHGAPPATDAERQEFETAAAAIHRGSLRRLLEQDAVRRKMEPELHERLMARSAKCEASVAAGERLRASQEHHARLHRSDPLAVHPGTKLAKADVDFERGHLHRINAGIAAGDYASIDHERDEHAAATAPLRKERDLRRQQFERRAREISERAAEQDASEEMTL